VHSPLTARSIAGAVVAAASSDPVAHLEKLLRDRYGARRVVLLDSGTSALALAMRATGGPVAVPAYCCFDIATACDGAAVTPVLYDLDPFTLAPNLASLGRAFERGARSVVVVHLYGIPVPMAEIAALAAAADAIVIEDAAQATGAWIGDRRTGGLGAFGVLSFGRGKGVTGGGGGALLLNDEMAYSMYEAVAVPLRRGSRLPARGLVATVAQWMLSRPSLYAIPSSIPFLRLGDTIYHRPRAPEAISAFSAALAARSLDLEDEAGAARRRNAAAIAGPGRDTDPDLLIPVGVSGASPGYLRLPLVATSTAARARLESPEARRLGVYPGYPRSLADLGGFRDRALVAGDPEGARLLADRLVTAPVHQQLSPGTLERLRKLLGKV
jgi:dTDP-4-amino-4,6-dideoxygalactose transaminase